MESQQIKHIKTFTYAAVLAMLLAFVPLRPSAQEIKGIVYELESSERARGVKVTNLRTQEEVETDSEGNFRIGAKINDYLVLSGAGFSTDTAFVYDESVKRIYLVRDENTIVINEVYVTRFTDSRLASEIEKAKRQGQAVEASQHRGGLRVSPSRLFGRTGKRARSNLEILLTEQENRQIDKIFSNKLIRSLTGMSDEEIPLFRSQYRPSLVFVQQASPEDLRAYIIESYSKFRKQ